ncbi:MAG TPA: hypothetical protein ACFYD6_04125 [Candidatus Brocadiia bacterium]|nr:hypothetical protein [Planctomycetota bacterium]MDO8094168.1 hypothetical protein [Candidatus Brocadiales bacterium]
MASIRVFSNTNTIERTTAQPAIGANAIRKSPITGTFGFSYFMPGFSILAMLNSFIVAPVTRHKSAWLSSWMIAPGNRKKLSALEWICLDQRAWIAKQRRIKIMSQKASIT